MGEQDKPDALLGFISGVSVSVHFMNSVFNLFKNDHEHRFNAEWLIVLGPYIHTNRNNLQAEFLKTGREWLFMVDNDMVFEHEDVWELFKFADEKGPGIYAAPYIIEDSTLAGGPWDDDIPYVYHPLFGIPNKPMQVGMLGTGFMLIHRDVLQAVGPGAFHPVAPALGEDVSFCWRAREAGYIPWLVPSSNPGHNKNIVLFPHEQARNIAGEPVQLVSVPTPKELREKTAAATVPGGLEASA